jgi:hypothetical protein
MEGSSYHCPLSYRVDTGHVIPTDAFGVAIADTWKSATLDLMIRRTLSLKRTIKKAQEK